MNGTEQSPEVSPHPLGQLTQDERAVMHSRAKTARGCTALGNWSRCMLKSGVGHFPTPYTKINSKGVKDVTVRPEP